MPVRAVAEVNLAAIERNVTTLRARLTGGARFGAVVKADGYGHGAVPVAVAAQNAGADYLAVATADEAAALRQAGVPGPLLVLGAISLEELPAAVAARAEIVAWDERFVVALSRAGTELGEPLRVHVKLDSGLGRLGTRDATHAFEVAAAVQRAPGLKLTGAMTHFATSDSDLEFATEQLRIFTVFLDRLRRVAPNLTAHAANSAGTLCLPASHLDLVRCGIAVYGADPLNEDPSAHGLEPALRLTSYVAAVKQADTGQSAGYGRRFIAERPTWLGTLPIGYGDGVSRGLTNNCDVLIRGRRYPLVGTVSMDNITVDLGPDPTVEVGEPAILIGTDGDERQTAEAIAHRLGTISYEVLCGISARVPRRHHRDGIPA
ncbi:MAG TPA: alanine racemase [Solirubrobacteraceae bacterium]|jgi:alanine racemase|nr:alanine racemase [Solirubrobacteraceae bacterium]